MSIIRVVKNKRNPYLIMNKTGLNDKRLSLKAKGLLAYLLSKPDNWYITTNEIAHNNLDGLRSILSTINLLVKYGYIFKFRSRDNEGTYNAYNYLVYEQPITPDSAKSIPYPERSFADVDSADVDNSTQLINKSKISNKTTALVPPKQVVNSELAVAFSSLKNKKESTIKLLSDLGIRNYKKLFHMFDLFDIFKFASWITQKEITMKNPTGFLISAIKEQWIDLEPEVEIPKERIFSAECSICGKWFYYWSFEAKYTECIKCWKKEK